MLSLLTRILPLTPVRFEDRSQRTMPFTGRSLAALVSIVLTGMALAGCGSSPTSGAKAGPIVLTNANGMTGPSSALSIGSTLQLSMMPSGDAVNAGVDWKVICGGNPVTGSITNGACGTISPTHTSDGGATFFTAPSAVPIGTTVTITAIVTTNPSQTSSLSLTILSSPIAVQFAINPKSSMQVSTSMTLAAHVTNGPADENVIWTAICGSAACGSFNPAITGTGNTTYTAPATVPAGGTVTISATSLTDTSKSASAIIAITGPPPPPLPITVSIVPTSVYVQGAGPGRNAFVTAVVSNDSTGVGVNWTVSCGTSNCGNISKQTLSGVAATFQNSSTVAVGGTLTLTATSVADPTKTATATATVVANQPISMAFSTTPPATLATGAQVPLAAAASSGTDGVNWSATCGSVGACGSFNLSPAHTANNGQIIYTAPATVPNGAAVIITASSAGAAPSNPASATTMIIQAAPPPPTLSFASLPPTSLTSATTASISVNITNDTAPGGAIWSATCGSTVPGDCGWFVPKQTASGAATIYTAPPATAPGTSVILTATSVADPGVTLNSTPITINPDTTVRVAFVPSLPSQIQTDATINLNATVANDDSHAGIDWNVCASGCGFFTIKPGVPAIPATATTPYVPPSPPVVATTVSGWPSGLPIPYTAPPQLPSTGLVAVVASAHADGSKSNSGTIAISPLWSGPALTGSVQAGAQTVSGASVTLYAAGTSGYGSASAQVATSLPTDNNGGFTVNAGYICPKPNSQVYLVATGGKIAQQDANPNRVFMTALGSCSNLASTPVVLNEITTVASAFATAPFAANDALTGNSSYLYLGTSGANLTGLSNAFAAVNNLVDVTTGTVRYTVPTQNAAVPYAEINTLADILNDCATTTGGVGGDGSACGLLLSETTLLGTGAYNASIAPADTLQAAFNIAQHPASNYGYSLGTDPTHEHPLISLATSTSPFQPILSTTPNDWSISLNYTNGGGLSSTSVVGSLAIDATGNLWITDIATGNVIEWNPMGAASPPIMGFQPGGGPIAIDATGNVWISGDGSLSELSSLGTPLPWSPFGGVMGGGTDIAFDAQSNLWISTSNGVHEFNNLGLQLSPGNGYTIDGVSNLTAVGIDSSNNVWIGTGPDSQHSAGQIVELTNPGGQLITSGGPGSAASQMAADGEGNVWYIGVGGAICEAPPYAGKGSTLANLCTYAPGGIQAGGVNILNARGIALDGAGTFWVASQGGPTLGGVAPPGVLPVVPGGAVANATPYEASSVAAGSLRVAVDGSGNVWVLLTNNTVTEYVGAATPVVTPIALGLQEKKLGAKP